MLGKEIERASSKEFKPRAARERGLCEVERDPAEQKKKKDEESIPTICVVWKVFPVANLSI